MANMPLSVERAVDNTKFEELCRLCGTRASVMIAYNIFEGEGAIRQICKKIQTCLQIQVHHHDDLPKLICENCFYKLEMFWEFRVRSFKTEELLIELCKQIKSAANLLNPNQNCVVDPAGGIIMVQNHHLIDDNLSNDIQIAHLTNRGGVLIQQEIILHHADDLHHNSLNNINLNGHDLGQDLSNQSLSSLPGTEPILVSESERLTQDNFNLMQQQQFILNEQFRLHHELQVNLTDESAIDGYRLTGLKDNLNHIDSHSYHHQEKTESTHCISTITYSKNSLTVDSNLNDETLDADVNSHINNIISYSSDSQLENLRHDDHSDGSNLLNDEEIHRVINKGGYLLSHDDGDTQDNTILQLNQGYFACTLCGKSFDNKTAFEVHYESHCYKCEHCLLAFGTVEILNTHKKTCGQTSTEEDQNSNESGKLAIIEDESSIDISVNIDVKREVKVEEDISNGTNEIKADEEMIKDYDGFENELDGSPKVPPDETEQPMIADDYLDISDEDKYDSEKDPGYAPSASVDEAKASISSTDLFGDKKENCCEDTYLFENGEINGFSNPPTVTKKRRREQNYCYYCEVEVTNFARHIVRNHSTEHEVQQILSLSIKSLKRKQQISNLRKKGNFLKLYTSAAKPMRKPNLPNRKIIPCPYCLGLYVSKQLYRHKKKCTKSPNNANIKQAGSQNIAAQKNPNQIDKILFEQVFPRMRPDKISMFAKSDNLICHFGARYMKQHREKRFINVTSRKMRELARIVLEVQKIDSSINSLYDCLKPEYFQKLVEAAKVCAGFDHNKDVFQAPTFVKNIATSIKQCCDIAIQNSVKRKRSFDCHNLDPIQYRKDLKLLIHLFESNWKFEMSSQGGGDLSVKKWIKITIIPLATDLKILRTHLATKASEATKMLNNIKAEREAKLKAYLTLLETVYCRLILFNRKRPSELQRMSYHTYQNAEQGGSYEKYDDIVTPTEKLLLQKYKRVVIRGEQGRGVPVILSTDVQAHLQILSLHREVFVSKKNPYLFAIPNKSDTAHLCGYKILKKHAKSCGAKNADCLTSTRLRKHLATLMQVFNMNDNDLDQLGHFMGHNLTVHKNSSRVADDVYQTAKISKLLSVMESGQADLYKGQSLDDIDLDLEDNLLDNAPPETTEDDLLNTLDSPVPSPSISRLNNPNPIAAISKTKQKAGKKREFSPWSDQEKNIVLNFFDEHISSKRPPKQWECEILLEEHSNVFLNKNWLKMKVFVQNVYTKKYKL